MECPIKAAGAAIAHAVQSGGFVDSTENPECTDKCAWYMDGKCAIAVIAAKIKP